MSELNVNISSLGSVVLEAEKAQPKQVEAVSKDNEAEIKAAQEKADEKKEVQPVEVEETVAEMNTFFQNMQRSLSFSVDEQLGEKIISVKDVESDEVIRQIPSEELVVLRKKMDDVVGILFDTKV